MQQKSLAVFLVLEKGQLNSRNLKAKFRKVLLVVQARISSCLKSNPLCESALTLLLEDRQQRVDALSQEDHHAYTSAIADTKSKYCSEAKRKSNKGARKSLRIQKLLKSLAAGLSEEALSSSADCLSDFRRTSAQ